MHSPAFAPNALPPAVREAVVATRVPTQTKRQLELTIDRHVQRNSRQTIARGTVIFDPAGDGLFNVTTEFTSNGIPFRTNFALRDPGIDCLRHQSVLHRSTFPDSMIETVELSTLSSGKTAPVEGSEYVVDMRVQKRACISPVPYSERHVGRAGPRYAARKLHSRFAGDAVDFSCGIPFNDVLQGRNRYAMRLDYGSGVETEMTSTEWVSTVAVLDVAILPISPVEVQPTR